jgi:hypothetical protein
VQEVKKSRRIRKDHRLKIKGRSVWPGPVSVEIVAAHLIQSRSIMSVLPADTVVSPADTCRECFLKSANKFLKLKELKEWHIYRLYQRAVGSYLLQPLVKERKMKTSAKNLNRTQYLGARISIVVLIYYGAIIFCSMSGGLIS